MKLSILLFAAAAVSPAAEKYAVYETEHFELITDGSRARAQSILAHFERVRSFFVKTISAKEPILKPRIVVFQSEKEFREYAHNSISAAYYAALPQRDYIAMSPANGDRDRRVAVHEYLHLLVRYTDVPLPVWMNEGVAELFSNIEQVGRFVRVGAPIPEHVFLIRNDWLPLSEVVVADHESKYYNRRQHAGPFYGISWALVHMLTLDPRYKDGFRLISNALADGATPPDAFRKYFNKSISEIEKDLQSYVRANTINIVNYEIQFDKVDEKVVPRAVTEYEWGVATADLLTAIHKLDQAAARLEALTNTHPQRPEAWESLTFVKWMHKLPGVNTAFAKARSLGSTQPNLGFWAPAFTKDTAAARDALRAAVEKYPAFHDARIRLAEQYLYNRDFQLSFDALKSISKISRRQVPAWFPVFIQASWYLGKLQESRSAASQFFKASSTDDEKERAKQLFAFAMKEPPKQGAEIAFTGERRELHAPAGDGGIGVDDDPAVIKLRRNPLTYSTGALINLECKEPAVLHFKTDAGTIKVVIDSPTDFQMINAADGKGELACGEQSRPAKLGFYLKEGLADGATAVARSIEFLP